MPASVNGSVVALLATTVPSETRWISHENSEGYESVKTSTVVTEEGGGEEEGGVEGDGEGDGDGDGEGDGEGDGDGDGAVGGSAESVKVWVLLAPKDEASYSVTPPTESVTLPAP